MLRVATNLRAVCLPVPYISQNLLSVLLKFLTSSTSETCDPPVSYSENGAFATRSAKFGSAKPST
jgi:hypothetical protein